MRQITITLPDSVELSEQEIQELILANAAGKPFVLARNPELATLLGRRVPPEELADLRHLIGLYYAERAADLVDAQWAEHGWTAETMHDWLREHMRTNHGRPSA